MDQLAHQTAQRRPATIVVALLVGLGVLALLFSGNGVDSDPPVCRSMFFYVVPCEAWVALAAGAAAAGLSGWRCG